MNYSLGNIISNGGAINPNGLSLDLAFAADKSLTARRGPTPTFSRASTATFVGSNGLIQSAAINAPRFDHDPVTLASRGLLIEEQRTNSVRHSENFTNPAWTTFGTSVSAIASTNPAGGSTSHMLTETATNVEHGIFISDATTGTVTLSVFVKQNGRRFCYLRRDGTANAVFDLTLGTVTQVTGGGNASITSFGNGWWRISFTTTEVGNWVIKLSNVGTGVNNQLAYLGDGTSGILLYGAQLEVGSFPTSYIPTTTASVIRSSDVCSIAGAAFSGFWNRFSGTCVIGIGSTSGATPAVISNTVAARVTEIYASTVIDFFEASGGQIVRINSSPTYPIRVGLAYAINDYQSASAGVLGGSDNNTGGTIPDATALFIGSLGGSSNRFNGHISSLQYYRRRLTNAQLQSLTA